MASAAITGSASMSQYFFPILLSISSFCPRRYDKFRLHPSIGIRFLFQIAFARTGQVCFFLKTFLRNPRKPFFDIFHQIFSLKAPRFT